MADPTSNDNPATTSDSSNVGTSTSFGGMSNTQNNTENIIT